MEGKVSAPASYDMVTKKWDVLLKPNEEISLLFKFLSFRDVSVV